MKEKIVKEIKRLMLLMVIGTTIFLSNNLTVSAQNSEISTSENTQELHITDPVKIKEYLEARGL